MSGHLLGQRLDKDYAMKQRILCVRGNTSLLYSLSGKKQS